MFLYITIRLKPFFAFKIAKQEYHGCHTDRNHARIAESPFNLGNRDKVHAVPTRNQRKR